MSDSTRFNRVILPVAMASLFGATPAIADVVTDWNVIAGDITVAAAQPPPAANRTLATVQTAVYEAVNAITKRYPADRLTPSAVPDASVPAAVLAWRADDGAGTQAVGDDFGQSVSTRTAPRARK